MSRAPGPAPVDPGLQPERTALAWTRTMIALCAVALLVLRLTDRLGPAATAIVAVVAVAGLAFTAGGRRRYRSAIAAIDAEAGAPSTRSVVAAAATTCLIGVLAVVAVLGR